MIFISTETLVTAYKALLEEYFNSDFVTQDYRWNEDMQETEVQIVNQFGEVERNHPQIVIRANLEQNVLESLGNQSKNQTDTVQDKEFETKVGGIDYSVRLIIRARRPIELDRIVDILFVGLVYPIKNALRANSIEVHPPFCVGENFGEKPLKGGNVYDKIHYGTLKQRIRGWWREYIDLKELENLTRILSTRLAGDTTFGPSLVSPPASS